MKWVLMLAAAVVAGLAIADSPNMAHEIWPKGKIPLAKENPMPEGVEPMRDDIMRIRDVSVPMVVVTQAVGAKAPTPAVVICPGGGYGILAWNHEGVEIAEWLKNQGITAFILKYRVPDQRDGALADAQRAIRWARANAKKFNVDPDKVGIMGFSAGANLTVRTATNSKRPIYEPIDDVDKESCRPDFQMPIYPWDLIERKDPTNVWAGIKGMKVRLADYPIDEATPPAFIVQSEDDFCSVETSLGYYAALKGAKIPAEMHIYAKGGHGGHGYGVRRLGAPTDAWPLLAETWLQQFR